MLFDRLYYVSLLAAGHGADPPLQVRIDTLVFSLIIFGLLCLVLVRYAWKPIMEGLEKRENGIADNIQGAQRANNEARSQLAAYEERLAGAADEAAAVIAEAKADALAVKEKIMADAAAEAGKIRERALAEIEAAKNAAVRELAESSVDSAVTLASSIVGRSLDRNDHQDLIEKSMKQFGSGA